MKGFFLFLGGVVILCCIGRVQRGSACPSDPAGSQGWSCCLVWEEVLSSEDEASCGVPSFSRSAPVRLWLCFVRRCLVSPLSEPRFCGCSGMFCC